MGTADGQPHQRPRNWKVGLLFDMFTGSTQVRDTDGQAGQLDEVAGQAQRCPDGGEWLRSGAGRESVHPGCE